MNRKTLIALIISIPLGSSAVTRGWTRPAGTQDLRTLKACSLLSQVEISAAVGVSMNPGKSDEFIQKCTWLAPIHRRPDNIPAVISQLDLVVEVAEPCEWDRHTGDVTNVSGLGEDAYYSYRGTDLTLNVKKGDLCVLVTWTLVADRQAVMDAEKSIAAQVLSRLFKRGVEVGRT